MDFRNSNQETIPQLLEGIMTSVIEALNRRNFDPNCFPWNHVSDNFLNVFEVNSRPLTNDKNAMLETHRLLAAENPDYHIHLKGLGTIVNERPGTAQLVMLSTSTGTPGVSAGIERDAVTIVEFAMIEGRWLCMRESTMSGMG